MPILCVSCLIVFYVRLPFLIYDLYQEPVFIPGALFNLEQQGWRFPYPKYCYFSILFVLIYPLFWIKYWYLDVPFTSVHFLNPYCMFVLQFPHLNSFIVLYNNFRFSLNSFSSVLQTFPGICLCFCGTFLYYLFSLCLLKFVDHLLALICKFISSVHQ